MTHGLFSCCWNVLLVSPEPLKVIAAIPAIGVNRIANPIKSENLWSLVEFMFFLPESFTLELRQRPRMLGYNTSKRRSTLFGSTSFEKVLRQYCQVLLSVT
jgi:hypothetical protein